MPQDGGQLLKSGFLPIHSLQMSSLSTSPPPPIRAREIGPLRSQRTPSGTLVQMEVFHPFAYNLGWKLRGARRSSLENRSHGVTILSSHRRPIILVREFPSEGTMFEPYTEKARRVIFFARFEAGRYGSPCIDTEHLLLGILREGTAIAMRLSRTPFTLEQIRKRIDELTPRGNAVSTSVDMPISEGSKRILGYAAEEAERLGDYYLGT